MDMGVSRRQAFEELRKRNDSEQVAQFVTALQQGEELGAPIVDTLIQIANDMRRTDAQNARRKAAKAVPKATMVITSLMVPATMILLGAGLFLGSGTNFGAITGE
jgi:tight adherence protein C